jgi:hypothetical protein
MVVGEGYVVYNGLRWMRMGIERWLHTKFSFAVRDYQFLSIRFIDNFSRLVKRVQQFLGVDEALVDCAIYAAQVRESEVELA